MSKRQFKFRVCSGLVDAHDLPPYTMPIAGSDASFVVTKEEARGLCKAAIGKPVQANHGQTGRNEDGTPKFNINMSKVGKVIDAYIENNDMYAEVELDNTDGGAGSIIEPFIDNGSYMGVSMTHFFGTDEFQEVSLVPKGARPNTGVVSEIIQETNATAYTPDVYQRMRLNVAASAASQRKQEQQQPRDPKTGQFIVAPAPAPIKKATKPTPEPEPQPVAPVEPIEKEQDTEMQAAPVSTPHQQEPVQQSPVDVATISGEQPQDDAMEDADVVLTPEEQEKLYESAISKTATGQTLDRKEAFALLSHVMQAKKDKEMMETTHKEQLKNHADVAKSILLGLVSNEQQRQDIINTQDSRSLLSVATEATRLKQTEVSLLQQEKDLLLKKQAEMQSQIQQIQSAPKRQRIEDQMENMIKALKEQKPAIANTYVQPNQPPQQNNNGWGQPPQQAGWGPTSTPHAQPPPEQSYTMAQWQAMQAQPPKPEQSFTMAQWQSMQQQQAPKASGPPRLGFDGPMAIEASDASRNRQVNMPLDPEKTPPGKGPWNGQLVTASANTRTKVEQTDVKKIPFERPDAYSTVTHPKWIYEARFSDPMIISASKFENSVYSSNTTTMPLELFSSNYWNEVDKFLKDKKDPTSTRLY